MGLGLGLRACLIKSLSQNPIFDQKCLGPKQAQLGLLDKCHALSWTAASHV